jgi:AcrR family transcriptional regulator
VKNRPIEKETIIEQALVLLSGEGLEGVTFRKLMARLKVKAPAIYWRFQNKQDLLEAMAEAILQKTFSDLGPMQSPRNPWQEALASTMKRLREGLLAYPDGARVVAGARPHQTPTLARIAEYSLADLERNGIPLLEAAGIVFTCLHYTFGYVIEEQSSPSLAVMAGPAAAGVVAQFPKIAHVIRLAQRENYSPESAYEFGLKLIIRGAEWP